MTRGDESFYVEAKCLFSKDVDRGASARSQRLVDALNSIDCPDFYLWIDVNQVGPADLPARQLRRRLEEWVGALDADVTAGGNGFESLPRFSWSQSGWELGFRAFAVPAGTRGRPGHRPIGIIGPAEAGWVNDDVTLRSALSEKGSAYGHLDLPLVIAINSFTLGHDDFDVLNALYGSEQITISPEDLDAPPTSSRKADGYWLAGNWAHRHVAGVLIGRSVAEYRPTVVPTFWTHPEPHDDVNPLSVWRVAELGVDRFEYREAAVPVGSLFGLPEGWPVGEAFPGELSQ